MRTRRSTHTLRHIICSSHVTQLVTSQVTCLWKSCLMNFIILPFSTQGEQACSRSQTPFQLRLNLQHSQTQPYYAVELGLFYLLLFFICGASHRVFAVSRVWAVGIFEPKTSRSISGYSTTTLYIRDMFDCF